ncbi:MAG: tetratricopeptide repeat protein [Bacteroidota bacterium]
MNIRPLHSIIASLLTVVIAGCGTLTDEQLWLKVEAAKKNNNWDSTRQVCSRILQEYPGSTYAPWAQFGLAESFRFKNQPREALDNYKIFYEKYPDMQPSAVSLFLIGYMYNNTFHLTDSAKIFYYQFLKKYPDHDLAPTVRTEIEYMGKDPAQVLQEMQRSKKHVVKK